MKKYICILLLLTAGCRSEDQCSPTLKNCFDMISISNAIPVQFWINGVQSFNTKIEPGVDRHCFNQLFNADDEIKVQFTGSLVGSASLQVINLDGEVLETLAFVEVDTGVWQYTLVPEDEGITNQMIKLQIVALEYENVIENPTFTTMPDLVNGAIAGSLAPSTSEGAGNAWTYSGAFSGSAFNTLPASLSPTQRFRMPLEITAGLTYKFELSVRNTDGGGGAGAYSDWKLYLTDGVDFSNVVVEAGLDLGTTVFEVELTADQDWPYVEITAEANDPDGQLRELLILNVELLSPRIEAWQQTETAASDWNFDNDVATVVIAPVGASEKLYQEIEGIAGNVKIQGSFSMTDEAADDAQVDVYVRFYLGGVSGSLVKEQKLGTLKSLNVGDIYAFVYDAVIAVAGAYDVISLECNGYAGPTDDAIVTAHYLRVMPEVQVIFYSDYLSIKPLHANTKLLRYSNATEYAGIVYDLDPVPNFMIRFKCKFYKERQPEENQSEALTTGEIVKQLGTTKEQKLLQVEPTTPYMNKKIKLALQHNTTYIDNQKWVKEDAYETKELDERFPFESAETWLTLQEDSYVANPFS